ncbi:hypothetical protein HAX54_047985 [Datura stramonium]|uniref:Uncharacterized protein n=1 Tax=Datura stramonium TaxID=4076 RepID=A0ABS8WIU9_DATST|nr:hypothetical protein [Datura stramonium]
MNLSDLKVLSFCLIQQTDSGCLIKKGSLLGTFRRVSNCTVIRLVNGSLLLLLASLFILDEDEDEEDSCRISSSFQKPCSEV